MQEKRMLLAIDCQYDFINGSMKIAGSEEIMKQFAHYITTSHYDIIAFTADWHPSHHCSFNSEGGPWAVHCVAHTKGAAIYEPLTQAAFSTKSKILFLTKGDKEDKEEYSIFENNTSTQRIIDIVKEENIKKIDICGIAKEYCVKGSMIGAINIFGADKICYIPTYTPEFSDPTALDNILKENNIEIIK